MNEYCYEPKPNNRLAKTLAIGCGLLAISLWYVSTRENTPIPALWQLGAVALLVAAIMLVTRFLTKKFVYTLYRDDEDMDDQPEIFHWSFKIVEYQSQTRRRVVCHMDAKDMIALHGVNTPDEANEAKKTTKEIKLYDYCVELFPRSYALLKMHNGDEIICVKFTPNPEMQKAILTLLSERNQ